jgi:hypothetical protein
MTHNAVADDLGPDEWESVPVAGEDDIVARYRNPTVDFILEIVTQSSTQYYVRIQQPVSADDYRTIITSHSSPAADFDGVQSDAEEFMESVVEDRSHQVRCLGVDEWDGGVDFICVYEDELPDPITDEIATDVAEFVLDSDVADPDEDLTTTDVPPAEADSTVTLDIFPRSFSGTNDPNDRRRRSADEDDDRDDSDAHVA